MVKRLGDNPLAGRKAKAGPGKEAKALVREELIHRGYRRETERAYEYLRNRLRMQLQGERTREPLDAVSAASKRVYAYLEGHEATTTPRMAKALGLDLYTVMRALRNLGESDRVTLITVPARTWKAPPGWSRAIIAASILPP